jgi:hypothetical protein
MVLSQSSASQSPASQLEQAYLRSLIAQIQENGKLSRKDHVFLSSTLLSAFNLSSRDRNLINRIFDQIHTGRIKLSDE